MRTYLDFEKPVSDLQGKVQELRSLGDEGDAVTINDEINRLEARADQALAAPANTTRRGAPTTW